jgi:predicted DNA-binding transcriptional regulator YafY
MTPFEKNIFDTLCPAIKEKKLIKFWYKDETESKIGWRKIEPHQIGKLKKGKSKKEHIILTGWFHPSQEQVWEGWDEGWKNYILERISKIEILNQTYITTRPGYNPKDEKRMSIVYCATSLRVI